MTRKEKALFIDSLAQEFKASDGLVVCDYKGLNTKTIEVLRDNAKVIGIKVQVIKNTSL